MGFFTNTISDPKEYIIKLVSAGSNFNVRRKGKCLYISMGVSRITGDELLLIYDSDEICDHILNFQKGSPSPIHLSYIEKIQLLISHTTSQYATIVIYEKEGPYRHIGGPIRFIIHQKLCSIEYLEKIK